MPLFDLTCMMCNYEYEKIVPFDVLEDGWLCPKCGGRTTRGIGNSSFVLNGSGWAKDGYK